MLTVEEIRERIAAAVPGSEVTVMENPGPAAQHSLLVDSGHGRAVAGYLRDDFELQLDYCSNATGVDWPDKEVTETVKKKETDAETGEEKEVSEKITRIEPGCLEAVYHLYSMALKHGPVIIRMRTANRSDQVNLPSLTPVWRSCEFQEREIYDLFGITFDGHPDLRRILMWDEFKDYVEPDDYEWEPTPHGTVLEKAKIHHPKTETAPEAPNG
jgi:NADH-quinone oxidoreductase subunit C